MAHEIFVFGSNLGGRHGKGAALEAKNYHGAKYGQAEGLQGRSYAIPTKDTRLIPLPLSTIESYVKTFIDFAIWNPQFTFVITRVGCGLAGYTPSQIAPFFKGAPPNCLLPADFVREINKS